MFLNCGVGEDSWEPLGQQKIKLVNPKGNQLWIFIGMTDAEAKAPILWPPNGKSQLTEKAPDTGKDWRQEERGTTQDGMAGWHPVSMDVSLSKFWEMVKDRGTWCAADYGVAKSRTWLSNRTTATIRIIPRMSLDQGSFCPLLGQSSWTCKEGCSTLNITSYSHVIFILKHICVSFVVPHYIFVMVSFLPLFLLPEECEVCPSKNRSIFNAFIIKDHHLKDHPHFECSNFVFMDLT